MRDGCFVDSPKPVGFALSKPAESAVRAVLEQSKSEGFDSCNRPSNVIQIGFR